MNREKAIMLYDFLLVKGGAEAVTLDLCNDIESLDLGVGFIDRRLFTEDPIASHRIRCLTGFTPIVGWQILKSSLFFRHRADWLKDYDRVIFSGICSPLSVGKTRANTANMLYCHTPPRFIYDLKDFYLNDASLPKRLLIKLLSAYLKPRYEAAIRQMDIIVSNSHNIRKRLKKHLGIDSAVIYPPCHIERYRWIDQGDFYLSTGRVEGYKRVDKIVEAFIKMPDKKLVVASGGNDLERLKKRAAGHDNIRFTGWCSQDQLKQLMGTCIATLYLPVHEDFGMSPVESMAAGKPVIGVNEGGVMETVIDGKTGILCPQNPQVEDIVHAVTAMTPQKALVMREACEQRARGFSCQTFFDKMQALLDCPVDELAQVAREVGVPG